MAWRNSEKRKVTGNEAGALRRSQQSHDLITVTLKAAHDVMLNGETLWGFPLSAHNYLDNLSG